MRTQRRVQSLGTGTTAGRCSIIILSQFIITTAAFCQVQEGYFRRLVNDLLPTEANSPRFYMEKNPSGSHIYISGREMQRVLVVSAIDPEVMNTIEVPRGVGMTFTSEGRFYLAAQVSGGTFATGSLYEVNPTDLTTTKVMDLAFPPSTFEAWDNDTLIIAETGGFTIYRVDLTTLEVANISFNDTVFAGYADIVAFPGSNKMVIADRYGFPSSLWQFTYDGDVTATLLGKADRAFNGMIGNIAVSPDGGTAYVPNSGVPYIVHRVFLNSNPLNLSSGFDTGSYPAGVAIDFGRNLAYCTRSSNSAFEFDVTTRQPTREYAINHYVGQDIAGAEPGQVIVANNRTFAIFERDDVWNYALYELTTAPEPEISVIGLDRNVVFSESDPTTHTGTDFGDIYAGQTNERAFDIENWGESNLTFSGNDFIQIENDEHDAFSLVGNPSSVALAPFGKRTFMLQNGYDGTIPTTTTATVRIMNNDATEPEFTMHVKAFVIIITSSRNWDRYE